MPLLGRAVMIAMYDVSPGWNARHDDWHSHEHMEERVSIGGFVRGRRYVANTGSPHYFVLYEATDKPSLVGEEYLARLNNPTTWSTEVMPHFTNMQRTICDVSRSFGLGVGGQMAYVPLRVPAEHQNAARDKLSGSLELIAQEPGTLAAHLCEGDHEASGIQTAEKALRGGRDNMAEWLLIVEGYEPVATHFQTGALAAAALTRAGATSSGSVSTYFLGALLPQTDLG